MSTFPPPPTFQTGGYQPDMQRNRRSDRNKQSAPNQKRKPARKRKKSQLITPGQLVVLFALLALVIVSVLSCVRAENSLAALKEERAAAERAYRQEVARHKMLYTDEIRYYAAVNNIDPAFVAAVIKRESDYDPYAISRVEARGLMQIMPDTGEWLAGKVDVYDFTVDVLYTPETNIKMGCWYLGYLSRMFDGDPILVASAYHAGQNNVKGWIQKYSTNGTNLTIDQIPTDDTRYYARKVMEAYAIYQQHHY